MTLYIVRPKTSSVTASLSLMSRKFTRQSRVIQAQEVTNFWQEDSVYQEIIHWLADTQDSGITQIAKTETIITGTAIVRMTEEQAEQMRRDLPDADVLPDQRIELIRPLRDETSIKTEVTDSDLWHLEAIGLKTCRQGGYEYTGKDITIAVLDTGVDATHPELQGKITAAYTFDVEQGVVLSMNPSLDTDDHGTHVSGLICGKNVGIAPGANIISGVMIPGGFGNISDFIFALSWVAKQAEVSIVNISAGISGYLPNMEKEIKSILSSGVLPVCAVGNDGQDQTRSPGDYRDVVSVGATNSQNKIAGFSSSGNMIVDNHQYQVPRLVAPGENVYSSIPGGTYKAESGTSMATPIISGVAGLILEEYPDIDVLDLRGELYSRCKLLKQPKDRQGYGLIQMSYET
ncbi:S8 family peptidase [Limnofasciculus baicalensis]|uniref:S8 family serine peptidase n=1 Tax=Limnofasciculus baicalensis BBK-W-15 TaxID=2699891 RepID=A0AAE3KNJ5_9CYAN|nr:S8 family serine peptidase [Limnofasciculus baicalensis]MCP2730590.1 S8 family serine peptidase [Limnofasciculus baicalensis BBK-W-15]